MLDQNLLSQSPGYGGRVRRGRPRRCLLRSRDETGDWTLRTGGRGDVSVSLLASLAGVACGFQAVPAVFVGPGGTKQGAGGRILQRML